MNKCLMPCVVVAMAATGLYADHAKVRTGASAVPPVAISPVGEVTFPPKLPGDDFEGAPHLIVFTDYGQKAFKQLCPDSKYGFGTPDDPLRALAQVYYTKDANKLNCRYEISLASPEYAQFPLNQVAQKTKYWQSINASLGGWLRDKRSYEELIKYYHKDGGELSSDGRLASPSVMQKQRLEFASRKDVVEGSIAILAAIRFEVQGRQLLLVFSRGFFVKEKSQVHRARFFIYEDGLWKCYGLTMPINGIGANAFWDEISGVAGQTIKITPFTR